MLRIGLTGGIGSGKSTVAGLFAARGVPVIDADAIAHQLTRPGEPAVGEIAAALGNDLVRSGTLDRRRLAERVFHDPAYRQRLESILHPRIRAAMLREIDQCQAPYCLLVIPLLIEAGQQDLVDRILVVDIDEPLQIERTGQRDARPESEIRAILAAQASRKQRLEEADDVIANSGDLATLEAQVEALHRKYLALAAAS